MVSVRIWERISIRKIVKSSSDVVCIVFVCAEDSGELILNIRMTIVHVSRMVVNGHYKF